MSGIDDLRKALEDEGPAPSFHRLLMKKHRAEWPVLWKAIDLILAESKPKDPEYMTGWPQKRPSEMTDQEHAWVAHIVHGYRFDADDFDEDGKRKWSMRKPKDTPTTKWLDT